MPKAPPFTYGEVLKDELIKQYSFKNKRIEDENQGSQEFLSNQILKTLKKP